MASTRSSSLLPDDPLRRMGRHNGPVGVYCPRLTRIKPPSYFAALGMILIALLARPTLRYARMVAPSLLLSIMFALSSIQFSSGLGNMASTNAHSLVNHRGPSRYLVACLPGCVRRAITLLLLALSISALSRP